MANKIIEKKEPPKPIIVTNKNIKKEGPAKPKVTREKVNAPKNRENKEAAKPKPKVRSSPKNVTAKSTSRTVQIPQQNYHYSSSNRMRLWNGEMNIRCKVCREENKRPVRKIHRPSRYEEPVVIRRVCNIVRPASLPPPPPPEEIPRVLTPGEQRNQYFSYLGLNMKN